MDTRHLTERVDSSTSVWGPTTIRYLAALLWLSNVSWKTPPDFGESRGACRGLCGYVQDGIDHPVFPGGSWFFETIVQPNLAAFGWMTLFVEATLAALLLSGRHLRIAGGLGIAQSLGIMAAVANTPGEWYWSYLLMAGLSLAVLVQAPVMRPTTPRVVAVVTAAYGVVVTVAHAGAGFAGDTNSKWTLFAGSTDFPDDFGRNVFPGSIALGLVLVGVAVAIWFIADLDVELRTRVGWGVVAVSALLLLTYGADGLILRLGSRATTAAVLAAVGLTLTPRRSGEPAPT